MSRSSRRKLGCVEEDIEMDAMDTMRKILDMCDPMDAKFDKIRDICNSFINAPMDEKPVKFIVLYNKPGNPPNAVPWTGIDQTMKFVKEKLEDGYVVQVKPFTKDEWSKD